MNLLRREEFHSPGPFHVTEPGGPHARRQKHPEFISNVA
jgi:hypothetical protein